MDTPHEINFFQQCSLEYAPIEQNAMKISRRCQNYTVSQYISILYDQFIYEKLYKLIMEHIG